MHATIGHVLGKIEDFKKCGNCGAVNWYENDICINQCKPTKFKKLKRSDVKDLASDYDDDLECEIDI